MADYMDDSETVARNLADAGRDGPAVERFMELGRAGERERQLRMLEKHRAVLLETVHKNERQIDCLDYLLFQMKKQRTRK